MEAVENEILELEHEIEAKEQELKNTLNAGSRDRDGVEVLVSKMSETYKRINSLKTAYGLS